MGTASVHHRQTTLKAILMAILLAQFQIVIWQENFILKYFLSSFAFFALPQIFLLDSKFAIVKRLQNWYYTYLLHFNVLIWPLVPVAFRSLNKSVYYKLWFLQKYSELHMHIITQWNLNTQTYPPMGSDCGSVGRVVTSGFNGT